MGRNTRRFWIKELIMAKRFIDTGIFDDDWFMDLSKEAKLLWIYFITKCDHAGLIKINPKLCILQTGIKDLAGTIKQLGNRLVTVSELLYFIPKFIEFQYPGFPNSRVRQQNSAMDILIKHNLFDKEKQTVSKDLSKSYEHEHDNEHGTVNDKGDKKIFSLFYDSEIINSENNSDYITFVKFLFGENGVERPFKKLLAMDDQIGYNQFLELKRISEEHHTKILDTVRQLENYNKKTYKSFYLTMCNWLKPKNNVR